MFNNSKEGNNLFFVSIASGIVGCIILAIFIYIKYGRKRKKVDDLEEGYTGVAQQSPRDVNKSQELQILSKRKPYMD